MRVNVGETRKWERNERERARAGKLMVRNHFTGKPTAKSSQVAEEKRWRTSRVGG